MLQEAWVDEVDSVDQNRSEQPEGSSDQASDTSTKSDEERLVYGWDQQLNQQTLD